MKKLGFIIVVLLLATVVQAQDLAIEYGDVSELGTVETVFVYTGTDLRSRQRIEKAIKKYDKHNLIQLADNGPKADVTLAFFDDVIDNGTYTYPNKNTVTGKVTGYSTAQRRAAVGQGTAISLDFDRNVMRMLWQADGFQGLIIQKSPERQIAKQFVEALYKAKGLRK